MIRTDWVPTKTAWDPKQETIKWDPKHETITDNWWDPKQILHNGKLTCVTKTVWDPTKIL